MHTQILQIKCIPGSSCQAANPWNSCQHGAMMLSRIFIQQLPNQPELAVFVCDSAPAGLPVALWCQPAHLPPVSPVEHSPAAIAHKHPRDWGYLMDRLKCLLFPTLLEFNTSLFTGPDVALVFPLSPLSFTLSLYSMCAQHPHYVMWHQ